MSRIFLSHSSANNAEAVALRDWLAGEGWDDVFLDVDPERGIAAGERWERALNEAAHRCEAVLFLASRAWLASGWCLKEFNLAHRLNKRLFGLIVDDVAVADLPHNLTSTWQLVRLSSGRDHVMLRIAMPFTGEEAHVTFSKEGLARLKTGLQRAGLDSRFFAWPPANDPDRPPYRGLRPLEAEDAGIFFGRNAPIIEALDRLRGLRDATPPRLLVILGASGAGKSSFMRAGILPRLQRDDANFLVLPVIRPERAAINGEAGLVRSLETALQAQGLAHSRAEIRAAINGGAAAVLPVLSKLVEKADFLRQSGEPNAKPPILLLPIDQGEELFRAEGAVEAEPLLALLRDLLKATTPDLVVVFTMRSDSYELLQTAKTLDGINQQTLSLPPLPKGAYQEVIEGPSERLQDGPRALKIDPALTQALLADIEAGGGRDSLPLLAFTLERLYLEYGGQGRLGVADYEALGRIKGSIEAAVERALSAADADTRIPRDRAARLTLLRRGFVPWLAGIDPESGSPRRRVARASEIPDEARPLIDQLVAQHLLSTDVAQDTGEVTIEPAHEALLRQWGLLQGWLEEDFGALTTLSGVQRAARDWAANGRNVDWLNHTGSRLDEAEKFAARDDLAGDLTSDAREYLSECRSRERAEQNERLQRLEREREEKERRLRDTEALAVANRRTAKRTGIGLVAALVLAVLASWQWRQARDQTGVAEQSAQQAREQRDRAEAEQRRADIELNTALSTQSHFLADLARQQNTSGDNTTGLLLATEGLPDKSSDDEVQRNRPYISPAHLQLYAGLSSTRETSLLIGHTSEVDQLSYSPNGQLIASSSYKDMTARIWDAKTGQIVAVLRGHTGKIYSTKFSPDGKRVVTASADGSARLWDIAESRDAIVLTGHDGPVVSAVFSPDGTRILTASFDKTSRVFDAKTGRQILQLKHESAVYAALFGKDGQVIVTATQDDLVVRFWDVTTGNKLNEFDSKVANSPPAKTDSMVEAIRTADSLIATVGLGPPLRISLDGNQVLVASPDGSSTIVNIGTGERVSHLQDTDLQLSSAVTNTAISDASFSPDGRIVAMSYWFGNVTRLWDVDSGTLRAVLHDGGLTTWSVVFSPDGAQVASVGRDAVRLWDVRSGQLLAMLRGHAGPLWRAAYSPDGRHIATGATDQTIRIWTAFEAGHVSYVDSGEQNQDVTRATTDSKSIPPDVVVIPDTKVNIADPLTQKTIAVLAGHTGKIEKVIFSSDSRRIVTTSDDNSVRIWNADTGKQIATLDERFDQFDDIGVSRDGRRILTKDYKEAKVWDGDTGRQISHVGADFAKAANDATADGNSEENPTFEATLSPTGRLLVALQGRTIGLWDVDTGRQIGTSDSNIQELRGAFFSPDEKRFVTIAANGVNSVLNTETGRQVLIPKPSTGQVGHVTFAPNGARAASLLFAGRWRLMNKKSGQAGAVLQGLSDPIDLSSFGAHQTRLVTASNRVIRSWDVATGRNIATIPDAPADVEQIQFAPAAPTLFTSHADHVVRVWNGDTGQAISSIDVGKEVEVIPNPDGTLVATLANDGEMRIWNATSGTSLWQLNVRARATFSPDGTRIASIDENRSAHIWDAATGRDLDALKPPAKDVARLVFNPTGDKILIVSTASLELWEPATGQVIRSVNLPKRLALYQEPTAIFEADGAHVVVSYTPDSNYRWDTGSNALVEIENVDAKALDGDWGIIDDSRGLWIWDASSGQELRALNEQAPVSEIVFSPDGTRLASASSDKIDVWDTTSGRQLATLTGIGGPISQMTFSPDGARISAIDRDRAIRIWSASTGQIVGVLQGSDGPIESAAFSADGALIVTHGADASIGLWDAHSGQRRAAISPELSDPAIISNDAKKLARLPRAESVKILSQKTKAEMATLEGHTAEITSVVVSPERNFAVTTSEDKTAKIWDIRSSKLIAVLTGHDEPVKAAVISTDRKYIATLSDHSGRIWNTSGKLIASFADNQAAMNSIAFSPDSMSIATTSDEAMRIWNTLSGQLAVEFPGLEDSASSVGFNPDGTQLVTTSPYETARVWDIAGRRQIAMLKRGNRENAKFSDDGAHIILNDGYNSIAIWEFNTQSEPVDFETGRDQKEQVVDGRKVMVSDATANVVEAETNREIFELKGHTKEISGVAWSPDGRWLGTYAKDDTLRVWDANSGREVVAHDLGDASDVSGALMGNDGTAITLHYDGTARAWDIKDVGPVALIGDPDHKIEAAAIAPDLNRVFTLSEGNSNGRKAIRVWQLYPDVQSLIEAGKSAATRCLTPSQRRQFYLDASPPRWCITGVGRERELSPESWIGKWPYHTDEWKTWLVAKQSGKELPFPESEDFQK